MCGREKLGHRWDLSSGEGRWNTSDSDSWQFITKSCDILWLVIWSLCSRDGTYVYIQFSPVAQSCPTFCNSMDCRTPGLPVHHQLPEFTQTHVHWVGVHTHTHTRTHTHTHTHIYICLLCKLMSIESVYTHTHTHTHTYICLSVCLSPASVFLGSSVVKNLSANVGDVSLIPGLERSPGEGNGEPFQYSCLGKAMDRGAWWITVHGVTKSRTQLSD